jgi:putative membrane protein
MDDKNDDKKGAEWDKEWIDDMVEMHEKDVKKFEEAQNDVADPELKTMVSEALPVLRSHLDMTKQIKAKMDK